MSKIKILYNNINSYIPKKHLTNHFIEQNNIKCAMYVEAKIKDSHNVNYRDWTIIKKIGHKEQNTRGGSLIQCHPSLKISKENPPVVNNPMNEVTHFSVPFKNDKLHIFLVYFHPNSLIEETLFTKASIYQYAIIVGDFNAGTRRKMKPIEQFLKNSNFARAETPPTFLMEGNEDTTPDLILYSRNIKQNISKIQISPDLGSDHLAFVIEFDMDIEPEYTEQRIAYNYKMSKITKIDKEMEKFIEENGNTPLSEPYIESFNKKLSESIKKHTPKIKRHPFLHELPPYIIKLIKNKRRMYREYCDNRSPELKKDLNRYNKNIHRMIQQYRENNWITACNNINQSKGKKFHNEVNKLSKYKQYFTLPIMIKNGREYKSDQEKAQLFAEHYKKRYKFTDDNLFDSSNRAQIDEWYDSYFRRQDDSVEPISIEEEDYYQLLHSSKNSSPGDDNIPWIVLKKLDDTVHKHLIKIYEFCLNECIFPAIWKTGHIINIPKANMDRQRFENYRPITLLPVLGKLYEKIIRSILSTDIEQHIPQCQFGFRNKRSTYHPLTILTSNIQNSTLKKMKSAVLSLDIQKAFDCIWHRGLLYKLHKINLPPHLIKLCKHFLEGRTLAVKVGLFTSFYFVPEQGTPQGSPLSTLLFNVFCHDIIRENMNSLYILQFADDTTLVSHAKTLKTCTQKLQELLDELSNWFRKWRMKINPDKSQFIIFDHKISPASPTLKINGKSIKPVPAIKYLGMNIDCKLNFNLHTKLMKRKTISRAKYFSKLVYRKQGINIKSASIIYKTICRPLLEYAHPVFANCKPPAIKNLTVAETTALRTITRMRHPRNPLHNPPNSLLYLNTRIEPIEIRMSRLNKAFYNRLLQLDEVISQYQEDRRNTSKRKHPELPLIAKIKSLI